MNDNDTNPPSRKPTSSAQVSGGPKFKAKADMERPKPKRFYKDVTLEAGKAGFLILLDGRVVKTPMKQDLLVPAKALAEAIAEEWGRQGEVIDLEGMIFTKLANTAIDRVVPRRQEIVDELLGFAGSDLLCYRASEPAALVEREEAVWGPFLAWLKVEHEVEMSVASGILHVAQEPEMLETLGRLYEPFDGFALTGAHNLTTLTGSAVLALALLKEKATPEEVWQAAHVDEDFQIERWGADEEASRRRALRWQEFLKTYDFTRLSTD